MDTLPSLARAVFVVVLMKFGNNMKGLLNTIINGRWFEIKLLVPVTVPTKCFLLEIQVEGA